ncbi:MAG: FeoB-associated Cys-rich membrane protein [Clostridia bacterium]|nr:FeoB-associated Cys-rich membrane protein [Clostridia bacterium]
MLNEGDAMGDYIVLGIVAVVLIAVIIYIVKQKKNGTKCIGCPSGKKCGSCSGCCDLNSKTK